MKLANVFVAVVTALVLSVMLAGCSTPPVAKDQEAPVGGSLTSHGVSVDVFGMSNATMSLDEALALVGAPVSLPDTATAGEVDRVLLNETGADANGNPGLAVLYQSGVKLFVDRRPSDLAPPQGSEGSMIDDPPPASDTRRVSGRNVLVEEPGSEGTGDADSRTSARLIWNQDGMGYLLIAPEGMSAEELLDVMRSIPLQGDA